MSHIRLLVGSLLLLGTALAAGLVQGANPPLTLLTPSPSVRTRGNYTLTLKASSPKR